jgi:hypothetical protein
MKNYELNLNKKNRMKAKFLWKRIPKSVKTDSQSEIHRIWSLTQFLIQRKYAQVFGYMNQLRSMNYEWSSPEIRILVNKLTEITRERLFDLLNYAYLTINVHEMAGFLSTQTDDAINIALSQNWTLDDSKLFLLPQKKSKYWSYYFINYIEKS